MHARHYIIIIVSCIGLYFQFGLKNNTSTQAKPTPTAQTKQNIPPEKILGSWIRQDGGYRFKFSKIKDQKTIEAAYFNPKKIHISQCSYEYHGDQLIMNIEFDDAHYKGSKYQLKYSSEQDKLYGTYFQATRQESYDVYFNREKK